MPLSSLQPIPIAMALRDLSQLDIGLQACLVRQPPLSQTPSVDLLKVMWGQKDDSRNDDYTQVAACLKQITEASPRNARLRFFHIEGPLRSLGLGAEVSSQGSQQTLLPEGIDADGVVRKDMGSDAYKLSETELAVWAETLADLITVPEDSLSNKTLREALEEILPKIRNVLFLQSIPFMRHFKKSLSDKIVSLPVATLVLEKIIKKQEFDPITPDHLFLLPALYALREMPQFNYHPLLTRILDVYRLCPVIRGYAASEWHNDIAVYSSPGRNDAFYDVILERIFPILTSSGNKVVIHQIADGDGTESALLLERLLDLAGDHFLIVSSNLARDIFLATQGKSQVIMGSQGQVIACHHHGEFDGGVHLPTSILKMAKTFHQLPGTSQIRLPIISSELHEALRIHADKIVSREADMFVPDSLYRATNGQKTDVATLFNVIDSKRFSEKEVMNALRSIGQSLSVGGYLIVGNGDKMETFQEGIDGRICIYQRVGDSLFPCRNLISTFPNLLWYSWVCRDEIALF